jgi:hypothetical protein
LRPRGAPTCCAHHIFAKILNQIRFGEMHLIEVTPKESAAAKARLDEHRKKRRERHAKNMYLHH